MNSFKIKHLSYRLDLDEHYYLVNLIFEPFNKHLIDWCEMETADYRPQHIIHDLEGYKKATQNVDMEMWLDNDKLNAHFRSLDKYFTSGFTHNNGILQRLKPPFENVYRFYEYFINNRIVKASLETLDELKLMDESHSQDLIDVLKTLENHWY